MNAKLSMSAAIFGLLVSACSSGVGDDVPEDTVLATDTTIRFIHYNDLHAHLLPHTTLVAGSDGRTRVARQGGMARLATAIARFRAEVPESVLLNVGDTYHGGVEALYTQGEAVAAAVNALGIDVGVPGNWDYAYGPLVTRLRYTGNATAGIQECIAIGAGGGSDDGGSDGGGSTELTRPNFPNLAANVTYSSGPVVSPGDPFLPPTLMKNVGGVSVGFIGISSDIVKRMHPMLACGLTFLGADDLETGNATGWDAKYTQLIQTHAKELRASGAVVVVVLSELGLQKDFHLANLLPSGTVDVMFSAHTHETVFTPLESTSGALVVEAGDDTYVGTMDMRIVDGAVVERTWNLGALTEDIPEDPAMVALVEQARAPFLVADPNRSIPGATGAQLELHEPITKVIGTVSSPLDRKQALDSTFNDFFTEALRTRAQTQVAMAPGFRFDAPIATDASLIEGTIVADGSVTLEDAYRFFPVVYKMGTARVSGAQLREVIESALEAVFSPVIAHQSGGWVEGFAGFTAHVALAAAAGSRIQDLILRGDVPVRDNLQYTIAGCRRPLDADGVLCSYPGFTSVQDLLKPNGAPWTNVEIFRDGLTRTPAVEGIPALIDTSGTVMWPASPFVQPLEGASP